VNPSGKLTFTIPASEEQLPAFDRWAATAHYNYFHGYALIDKLETKPEFAFGYGLSYTTFSCSTPQTDQQQYYCDGTIRISVTVCNTGACDGAEVIQCYIGESNPATQPSPVKRLYAFEKIWLKAGEKKTVTLEVPVQQLARYNTDQKTWRVIAGDYAVWIGNSSGEQDLHQVMITVKDM
jgi:beta-glucosidase